MISSLPRYAYTENEDTLFMHLHLPGEIQKEIAGRTAVFQVESGMPWNGRVTITYTGRQAVDMKLAVRIPGWCENWKADGLSDEFCTEENGYVSIGGTWENGRQVLFTFDMKSRFYQADDRVREVFGKTAIMRGPVVYCAEEADNGKNLHTFRLRPSEPVRDGEVSIGTCKYPALYAAAEKKVAPPNQNRLYAAYQAPLYEPAELLMIPYFAWANRGENDMAVWFAAVP